MTTALDIVTTAMLEIGAIGLGEAPTAAEAISCLDALNDLLSQNNNETTMIYSISQDVYSLVGNQRDYTFGTGGTTSTTRFEILDKAYIRNSSNVDFPLDILTYDQYSDITTKAITSTFPFAVYDNKNYPIRTLSMYPIPTDATYSLVLWTAKQLARFNNLTDVITTPEEYLRYYKTNLAIEIAARFGREPSNSLVARALESKTVVERNNNVPLELGLPDFGGKRGNVLGEYLGAMM